MKILIDSQAAWLEIIAFRDVVFPRFRATRWQSLSMSFSMRHAADLIIRFNYSNQTFEFLKNRYNAEVTAVVKGLLGVDAAIVSNECKIMPSAESTWFILKYQTATSKQEIISMEQNTYDKIMVTQC